MDRVVVLDAGPLGLISNPRQTPLSYACSRWSQELVLAGVAITVPEIADYEVRRELLRANKRLGLSRLDAVIRVLDYRPIDTAAMRRAASFWAQARQQGQPTAAPAALDADVSLAGQVAGLMAEGNNVVVATTNVRHLARYVPASRWQDIQPG